MKRETYSREDTQNIAQNFAKNILEVSSRKKALVVALSGELGAGKTTFAQGFAAGLGVAEPVLSPTFLIVKSYPLSSLQKTFWHIDCYRIQKEKELLELGWQDIVQEPDNIILIEWPERVAGILPEDTIRIKLEHSGRERRTIFISS